jgi:hypothetical protein
MKKKPVSIPKPLEAVVRRIRTNLDAGRRPCGTFSAQPCGCTVWSNTSG